MISIKNLTKVYGKESKALDNINLSIEKGEIFGIIGLSGAGKSTLLRCLNGLEKPSNGNIFINELDITNLKKEEIRLERKEMGMIFQHFNLLNQKNVFQNIAMPLVLDNKPKSFIENKVDEVLNYIGLEDKKYKYPKELSGGEKQRVAIARAIINSPKILLCDEATSALDPNNTKTILKLLQKINNELNITIVLITHQMDVVKEICHSVAILEKGQVIEQNSVENLFKSPKSKIAKSFLYNLDESTEEFIDSKNYDGLLLKLTLVGNQVKEPIVTRLVKEFDISVNIISGNIKRLQSNNFGNLILELSGDRENIDLALNFLDKINIHREVLI